MDVLQQRYGDEILDAGCSGATTATWTQRSPEPPDPSGVQCKEAIIPPHAPPYRTDAYGQIVLPLEPAGARVVVALGVNDMWFHGAGVDPTPVEPAEYKARLGVLLDWLEADGAAGVALMKPWAGVAELPDAQVARLEGYAAAIDELVAERSPFVVHGPDWRRILPPDAWLPSDPSHPTAAGHAVIAAHLADFLEKWAHPDRKRP